ncbi:hypothetical protein V6N13_126513 [Hibiscus sabdariffa]|uniref:RNA-binding S4 domain-containing protein n=1 Tax=Hibiscus sabdariffa TaxID=183260 RepID=A0ABR2RF92_9ROSI
MVHVCFYRNYGKTFKKPRRPYEKERLDAELRLVGEYGLRCKREFWRVQYALSRVSLMLLWTFSLLMRRTFNVFFEGEALLRRMNSGKAKSIHHARVLIRQRHIRVGRQVVNIPSFMVRVDSQKHIDFSLTSPFGGGRPGRVKRKNQRAAAKKAAG